MIKRRKPLARNSKPIPRSPLKRSTKPIKPGKKMKADKKNVRELKRIFEQMNITFCEICGTRDFLSFAHSRKRRFITDDAGMKEVALLCIADHEILERLPHELMFERITEIINKREEKWN